LNGAATPGGRRPDRSVAKARGEMARNSLSRLARGAAGVMFFQSRAPKTGAEKFHSAMVRHAGPDSRVFREVCELGATLQDLAPVRGSRGGADIAILYDWESQWAQDLPWRPSVDLGHRQPTPSWYGRLWRAHHARRLLHPAS